MITVRGLGVNAQLVEFGLGQARPLLGSAFAGEGFGARLETLAANDYLPGDIISASGNPLIDGSHRSRNLTLVADAALVTPKAASSSHCRKSAVRPL